MDRTKFLTWYEKHAQKYGLDPNPYSPLHFYDYEAAYKAGAEPNSTGHWPSQFKLLGHPNLIVNGVDTRTGTAAPLSLFFENLTANDAVEKQLLGLKG